MSIVTKPAGAGDYKDLVIEQLADERAEFEGMFVSVLADAQSYRDLLQAALGALHHLVQAFERLQRQHYRLLDAHRQERPTAGKRAS